MCEFIRHILSLAGICFAEVSSRLEETRVLTVWLRKCEPETNVYYGLLQTVINFNNSHNNKNNKFINTAELLSRCNK
jgi:hypothetical protein